MSDKLKPVCCGCGGEPIIGLKEWEDRKGNYHENSFVYCDNCSISTGGYLTEAEAITAWNRAMGHRDNLSPEERTAKVEGHRCTACDNHIGPCMKYCPNCDCRLEWNE